jgi:hypothetical protein
MAWSGEHQAFVVEEFDSKGRLFLFLFLQTFLPKARYDDKGEGGLLAVFTLKRRSQPV